MHRAGISALLVIFIVAHVIMMQKLVDQHASVRADDDQDQLFTLPSSVMKIAALEYKGIASDILFVKGLSYVGSAMKHDEKGRVSLHMSESQWKAFYDVMDVSTDLDPYFQDPYYIATSFLTWDAGMIREANALLEKGSRYRDWDWSLPFFAGFNYFYFLGENDKAAEKLMEASRRPLASPTLATLASKLAFKAKKTEASIQFLEEMIRKAEDAGMKKQFETRLDAYKRIFALEQAAEAYRKKFRKSPRDIGELVKQKIIAELPNDPYGGKYYLDAQGAVRTTSEVQLMPYIKNKK